MAGKPAKKAAKATSASKKAAKPRGPATAKAKAKAPASKPRGAPKPAARKVAVRKPAAAEAPPAGAVPVPEVDEWQAVAETVPQAPAQWAAPPAAPGWAPPPAAPAPQQPAAPALAFDPATGNWVAPYPPGQAAAMLAPEAPHPSGGRRLAWNIVLGIDLGLLGLNFLIALLVGFVLVFFPQSAQAEEFKESFGTSTGLIVFETLLTFTMMGIVPFLWILFTRRVMWEGTKRYLKLHSPLVATIQGVVLTAILLAAVAIMSLVYIVLTEGPDGLTLEEEADGDNPAVDAVLANLTWPVAILIAVCAGVGEEILFRGVLLRRIGLWGQAVLFGLAHAAGGYIPQILFAFGLAVLFGYLLKRGVSLWALILAHTLYDLVLLSIGLVFA